MSKAVSKSKMLRVRVTLHEAEKLASFAKQKGTTYSHVLREYIRRLPNTEAEGETLES